MTDSAMLDVRPPKRLKRTAQVPQSVAASSQKAAEEVFGPSDNLNGRLHLGARTAVTEWRVEDFASLQKRTDGACIDGPKFGQRDQWQLFCHPDGRCNNQPEGGPPGVFLRYLGPHERVIAYATIEKLINDKFVVPQNNKEDSPFVVLFGRNEIEEWGVCKDFGLFDTAFGNELTNGTLVLRCRVGWIEPRADSLLPREAVPVRNFANVEGSLESDLGGLWNARRPVGMGPGSSGGVTTMAVVPVADLVLVCDHQRFEVDRVILSARSAFVAELLCKSDDSDKASRQDGAPREVNIPGVSPRGLAALLQFAYTDDIEDMKSAEEAEETMTAAAKFKMGGVVAQCSDCLREKHLTVSSAVRLLRLADDAGAASLRAQALELVGANWLEIKSQTEWRELLSSGMNPELIQDIMQAVHDSLSKAAAPPASPAGPISQIPAPAKG